MTISQFGHHQWFSLIPHLKTKQRQKITTMLILCSYWKPKYAKLEYFLRWSDFYLIYPRESNTALVRIKSSSHIFYKTDQNKMEWRVAGYGKWVITFERESSSALFKHSYLL